MEACNGVFVRHKQMMSVRFQNSANIGRPRILPGNKTLVTFVYPGAKNIECKVHWTTFRLVMPGSWFLHSMFKSIHITLAFGSKTYGLVWLTPSFTWTGWTERLLPASSMYHQCRRHKDRSNQVGEIKRSTPKINVGKYMAKIPCPQ